MHVQDKSFSSKQQATKDNSFITSRCGKGYHMIEMNEIVCSYGCCILSEVLNLAYNFPFPLLKSIVSCTTPEDFTCHTRHSAQEPWYRPNGYPSNRTLKMDSSSNNDACPSPTSPVDIHMPVQKESGCCSNGKTKSPHSKVTVESVDDDSSSTHNIKFKKYTPHTDPKNTDDKSYNRNFSSGGYTGIKAMFEPCCPSIDRTSPQPSPKETKLPASPIDNKHPIRLEYNPLKAFSFDLFNNNPYEKTTYKCTFPIPLDSTFTIPALETRSSLMLLTMDLVAHYDNHFHRTEYSNSLLRQAKEDAERRIEELDWKVRCFAEEESIHAKDMEDLGAKLQDVRIKLENAKGENKGLRERVKEDEGLAKKVTYLVMEVAKSRNKVDRILQENKELRGKIDDLEEIKQSCVFMKDLGKGEEQIANLREKIDGLQKEVKSTTVHLRDSEVENSNLKERIEELETEMTALRDEQRDLEHDRTQLQELVEERDQDIAKYLAKIDVFEDRQEQHEEIVETYKTELQYMRELVGEGKDEQTLRARIKNLQQQNAGLEENNDALEAVLEQRVKSLQDEITELKETKQALEAEVSCFKGTAEELVKLGNEFARSLVHRAPLAERGASEGNKVPNLGGILGPKADNMETVNGD